MGFDVKDAYASWRSMQPAQVFQSANPTSDILFETHENEEAHQMVANVFSVGKLTFLKFYFPARGVEGYVTPDRQKWTLFTNADSKVVSADVETRRKNGLNHDAPSFQPSRDSTFSKDAPSFVPSSSQKT